jgi:hypothetical protein
MSVTWPKTPTTCSPRRSGTELTSTAIRLPSAPTITTPPSVTVVVPTRCDDGGELAPASVADDALGRTVQPADDAGRIDDVARHIDVLENFVDLH